jgi:hypothetical protein
MISRANQSTGITWANLIIEALTQVFLNLLCFHFTFTQRLHVTLPPYSTNMHIVY